MKEKPQITFKVGDLVIVKWEEIGGTNSMQQHRNAVGLLLRCTYNDCWIVLCLNWRNVNLRERLIVEHHLQHVD